ncbi:UDP-N-acetylmuramate--L-alanine ligase [Spirulina major CS-329]|uniref:UDP-N-acetylmuramate--L-alanine ligase n=1 Tax=Spirulina TaxID=1154 RepID=UPI00232DC68E|nr:MULTISPECIES: UDP-N-acetylmuramate--L-alanine ligase [Spirulina]MDB9494094.1 UDP-N-acetylmuramate--L-alanine ligase [Spirulina subsalsa CS-330]MDB9505163.1 UDP-N-acetylmuramate--L-alanine ligase [Spirulina major CS-329]
MSKTVDFEGKPFHFIGIGGIGMSALAYILAKRSLPVSGSDLRSTHITQRLESVGARIFNQQAAANLEVFHSPAQLQPVAVGVGGVGVASKGISSVPSTADLGAPQVVCSTAIQAENQEYCAALDRGYAIFHRSDVLAALVQDYESVAVAGTHGKTTTSSLVSYLLLMAGLDPTVVVGGEVDAIGGNARLGQSRYLVAEADESDGSLVKLSPAIGVVTNIELDHPDHYQDLSEVVDIFQTFARQTKVLIGCADCATVREQLAPSITYSTDPKRLATYTVSDVVYGAEGTTATVWERGIALGRMTVPLLGEHNLGNALAAIAVARQLGIEFEVLAAAMTTFAGAKRRFEVRGVVDGITLIDDYAHHPSELQVTLAAAQLRIQELVKGSDRPRIIAIFQPHRYSRTLAFLEEFTQSFRDADVVIVTDIYSAGEPPNPQITGQMLADAIADHHQQVIYQPSLTELKSFLQNFLHAGDFALFLGAGNLNQIIPQLLHNDAI